MEIFINNQEEQKLYILLLERENEALRSVLCEWEQDKSVYLQMNHADNIRAVIYGMKRPSIND